MPTTVRTAEQVDVEAAADDVLDALFTAVSTLTREQALDVICLVVAQLATQVDALSREIARDA
jgi:hypothetical protein